MTIGRLVRVLSFGIWRSKRTTDRSTSMTRRRRCGTRTRQTTTTRSSAQWTTHTTRGASLDTTPASSICSHRASTTGKCRCGSRSRTNRRRWTKKRGPHRRGPAPRALGDALLSGLWRRDPDRNSDPGRHIPRTALRTRLRRWCGRDRGARELPAATLAGREAEAALIKYWDGYDIMRPDG